LRAEITGLSDIGNEIGKRFFEQWVGSKKRIIRKMIRFLNLLYFNENNPAIKQENL